MGVFRPLGKGKAMGNSIDPLAALIQQSPILTSIAVVILLAICALLVAFRRQQLRLAAMQKELDDFSHAIDSLRVAHEGLLVRFMNNRPRSRKSPKLSGALEEKTKQPDEKSREPSFYLSAPKTSPE